MDRGVFINYRGEDSHSYGALLYTALTQQFGDDQVFLDCESIPAGADFAQELLGRVRSARVLLAVIGPRWLTVTDSTGRRRIDNPADWIRQELVEAFVAGVRVIPVLTEQTEMPVEAELPADIAALSRCQYRRLRYREPTASLARIVADLYAIDPALATTADSRSVASRQPLATPGLSAGRVDGVHVHADAAVEMPVPRQLLPAPRWFADRSPEFRELNRLLDDSGHRIGVIYGPGGVGKTALALRWIHGVADRFPDGQLFMDLGAFNPGGPVSPGEVLGRFLRALGVPAEAVPVRQDKGAELAEQAALYRSVTARRSIAVLLDNAESVAQVRPLLPASETSVAVVTSRWRLGGLVRDGAYLVPLAPLGPDAAVELLTRSVGADRVEGEPGFADRLVQLCGYMPLAVSIAGARLATRPRRSIARAVDELADRRSRLTRLSVDGDESVAATFDLSYQELPPDAARSYRLLGLHPGPDFGHEVTAAAVGIPVAKAEDLLDVLVDASLMIEVGEDRYRFHDLLRLHAQQRAEAEEDASERDGAVHRMILWYLRATIAADRTVIPLAWRLGPGYQKTEDPPRQYRSSAHALDWMESALPNLIAALRTAVSHRWDALAWQLCEAMWSLFFYRRPMPEWISIATLAIESAARTHHQTAESQMRRLLGSGLQEAGQFAAAEREAAAALAVAQAAGHELLAESALQLAGTALRSQGKHDQAIAVHRKSLALSRHIGDSRREALALRRLGQSLSDAGQLDEAIQYLREGCAMAAALPDDRVEALTTTILAATLTKASHPAEAIGLLESALTVMRESGSDDYEATVLTALGDAAERLGDLTAAREHFRHAVDLHAKRGGPQEQVVRDRLAAVESTLAYPPPVR